MEQRQVPSCRPPSWRAGVCLETCYSRELDLSSMLLFQLHIILTRFLQIKRLSTRVLSKGNNNLLPLCREKVGIPQISMVLMWVLELISKAARRLFSSEIIYIYIFSSKQAKWAVQIWPGYQMHNTKLSIFSLGSSHPVAVGLLMSEEMFV